ncbi:BON domain-containing protein [Hymenobacter koreensis]|uniref:BON domain-containing protein n=1 Tax=Hymenobacter koreensis TaxID=1084523 RepID=A0ABP8J6C6_9BACT
METLNTPTTAEERLADSDITAAVEQLFRLRKGVGANHIQVATQAGVVLLTGFTENLLARERAADIALAVRGVCGVVNQLEVKPPDVPDARLQHDVNQALQHDPAVCHYPVSCRVHSGTVTALGTLQTWAEKRLVLNVLKGVRGVRSVADRLTFRGSEIDNTDDEITAQIRAFLDWSIRVNSALVEISTRDKVVHVSGTVGTAAEKEYVVETAYTAGATRVDAHNLLVAAWALSPELRRNKYAPRTDAAVAKAVHDVLRHDPRLTGFAPAVLVKNGVVTLTGSVGNLRAKRSAEQDARGVVGVWEVENQLLVPGQAPEHAASIRQHLQEALARDPYVGHYTFSPEVQNGEVQLLGTVRTHFEQQHAEEVATGIDGVTRLENRVQVQPSNSPFAPQNFPLTGGYESTPQTVPDSTLEQRIRNHFFWCPTLHAQEIQVAVERGRATLTGTVDTWLDRKKAARDAREAGARDVNNHLRVATPGPLE